MVLFPAFSKAQNNPSLEFTKKYTDTSRTNFLIGTALNITTTSPNKSSNYYQNGGRSYTSYKPAVSFGLDVYANPNTQKLMLRIEVALTSSTYQSLYQNKITPYVPVKSSFDELWFSFSPQIIYNFYSSENFKFYAGAGVLFTYFKFSNSYYRSQDPGNPNAIASDPYDFNEFDNPIMLKAGMQFFKRFGIFVNYLTSVPTTRGGFFDLSNSGLQIGLNYYLK